ncbi:MAG: CRISPR-associated RAMP protein Csx10 [Bacillota bacterium]
MKVITYRVTLLELALLTALEGDPNESVSFDYVPGSVLRGALIKKFTRAKNLKTLDAADGLVRRLFFDGTTRYLNGYPLDRQGKRALPVPLSWQQDKKAVSKQTDEKPAPIYDFAINDQPKDIDKAQGVKKPFCTLTKEGVRLIRPERQLSIHTARNRRYGRAVRQSSAAAEEDSGAVYRYEALAAGQTFGALILCDRSEDAELLLPLLEGEVFLGGSQTAGYGRAKIDGVRLVSEGWREVDGELTVKSHSQLIVTLLSDALLRDENGQFTANPDVVCAVLNEKLGVKLKMEKAFIRAGAVGGFNRKWGLPLPQALAIKMGSVFVYQLIGGSSYDVTNLLEQLEAKGIGERRAEGFGRLAFNWHTKESLEVEPPVPSEAPKRTIVSEESRKIAERMVTRMFERRLENRLAARAVKTVAHLADDKKKLEKLPSDAQISRLRSIIQNELIKEGPQENPDPQRVLDFLSKIKSRKPARKQFERARIGSQSLLEWLEGTLNKTDLEGWKGLLGLQKDDFPELGGVRPVVDESLRKAYILRYIDAVLAYAAKQRKKEGS